MVKTDHCFAGLFQFQILNHQIYGLLQCYGTLKYLVKLLDTSEHGFEVVHEFVFDRTRAIRQDLTIQNIINYQSIVMHEQMVCLYPTCLLIF